MEEYLMSWVVTGVVFWATTFFAARYLLPKRSLSFCNRIVSTIHSTAAVTLAALSVSDWSCPLCPLSSNPTVSQTKCLVMTLSYLLYDTVCCQFDKEINWDTTVHHVVSVLAIGGTLAYKKCASEVVAGLLITEISTPFLNMREFLKDSGIRNTDINLLNDIIFGVIFSVARMVAGPYITYTIVAADNPALVKGMAAGLQVVSLYWFFRILRMMKHKLGRRLFPARTPTPH